MVGWVAEGGWWSWGGGAVVGGCGGVGWVVVWGGVVKLNFMDRYGKLYFFLVQIVVEWVVVGWVVIGWGWVDFVEEPMKYQTLMPHFFSVGGWCGWWGGWGADKELGE